MGARTVRTGVVVSVLSAVRSGLTVAQVMFRAIASCDVRLDGGLHQRPASGCGDIVGGHDRRKPDLCGRVRLLRADTAVLMIPVEPKLTNASSANSAPGRSPQRSQPSRLWLAVVAAVSVLAAVVTYAVSEYMHRRQVPTPTPTPAG